MRVRVRGLVGRLNRRLREEEVADATEWLEELTHLAEHLKELTHLYSTSSQEHGPHSDKRRSRGTGRPRHMHGGETHTRAVGEVWARIHTCACVCIHAQWSGEEGEGGVRCVW